jgi:hypothetical protein
MKKTAWISAFLPLIGVAVFYLLGDRRLSDDVIIRPPSVSRESEKIRASNQSSQSTKPAKPNTIDYAARSEERSSEGKFEHSDGESSR